MPSPVSQRNAYGVLGGHSLFNRSEKIDITIGKFRGSGVPWFPFFWFSYYRMKIYVQSINSAAFAIDAQHWTIDQNSARVFRDTETALQFCLDNGLKRVKILIENCKGSVEVFVPSPSVASVLENWRLLRR